jgi:hypothetical protein
MTTCVIPYKDGNNTQYGVIADEDQQSLLDDLLDVLQLPRTAPFGQQFATLSALQAVSGWNEAIAAPPGLVLRQVKMALGDIKDGNAPSAGLGTVTAVVGDETVFDDIFPTGVTPFPGLPNTTTAVVITITGATGESRNSN